ncbi:MAG TPA: hypothetical protein VLB85_03485 [Acidimicrobiia bacterium]|nr:hypothetical protein [Acidimicrobiia bacterium]
MFVRWASALLAVSGLVTAALAVMPDAFYRFLAWPNGIAMVALGNSLWQSTRTSTLAPDATPRRGLPQPVSSDIAHRRDRRPRDGGIWMV